MAETTTFELVTPDALLSSEPVGMVVIPGGEGDFGALPRHAPFISTIRPGVIRVYRDGLNGGITQRLFVSGGFADVTPERCTVLAEEAIDVADLTSDAANTRLAEAEAALEGADSEGAKAAAERAHAVASAMVAALQ